MSHIELAILHAVGLQNGPPIFGETSMTCGLELFSVAHSKVILVDGMGNNADCD
jgi:hypothetical protein